MVKTERYSRKKVLEFPWSSYQRLVFEAITTTDENLAIEAVAGSGKTKTIEGIVASTPAKAKVAVLAFNNHIVEELKRRIPESIATVTTAHRVGKVILVRYFGGNHFYPNEKKYRDVCSQLINSLQRPYLDYWRLLQEDSEEADRLYPVPPPNVVDDSSEGKAYRKALVRHLEQLVHFAQITLSSSDPDSLRAMVDHFSIHLNDDRPDPSVETWLFPLVAQALEIGVTEAIDHQNVGLDDLIWLPNRLNIKPMQKDFVIVDEAQDSNRAIVSLYLSLVQDGGRLILLGDKRQAIMGFAGSDANAWDMLKQQTRAKELPLSICYRCPSSHLELARAIVPQIQPRSDAPEGRIEVLPPTGLSARVESGDLIICRFTSPLVSLCLKLISLGKKAKVRGRDIGQSLTSLAKQACERVSYPGGFVDGLDRYCQPRIEALKAADEDLQAQSLEDKRSALKTCFNSFGFECRNLQFFCQMVEDLFCDDGDRPPITLSTIHRAKGDESDRVFLLGTNTLPFKARVKKHWQAVQEDNLLYVALTRSRQDLFLIPLPDRTGKLDPELLEDYLGGMELPDQELEEEAQTVESAGDRNWTPAIGETIHKRHFEGWRGEVVELDGDKARVRWLFDPMPELLSIGELRPLGTEVERDPEAERRYWNQRKQEQQEMAKRAS